MRQAIHHLSLVEPDVIVFDAPIEGVVLSSYSPRLAGPIPVLLLKHELSGTCPSHCTVMFKPFEPEAVLNWVNSQLTKMTLMPSLGHRAASC